MKIIAFTFLWSTAAFAGTDFWAPLDPPHATYLIEARICSDASRIDGSETIRFTNNTSRSIGRIALLFDGQDLKVRANGVAAARVAGVKDSALFELSHKIAPGESMELVADWSTTNKPVKDGNSLATSDWYPRLWWGYESLADYRAKIDAPAGIVALIAGKRNNGVFEAPDTRALGLVVARGMETKSADAGGVTVTTIFTQKGSDCAHLLLKTAVDAISYYQKRFGFYPHNALLIVPGGNRPAGGFPVATALVAIHGEERMQEKPDDWWKWIITHEIGHMYWSEHVLAQGRGSLNWLLIGLGIHADQDYRRARGIDAGELWRTYVSGVEDGYDTTMDLTASQQDAIQWDFNNIVMHGKSSAMVNALESAIGAKTFNATYRRCLYEYAGKRLGWRDFQRVAEEESGQDLDWFFEQWVRSPTSAAYKVAARSWSNGDCTVRIQKTGTMYMPVSVAAQFEDGTEQRAVTERLADEEVLHFRAASPLTNVVIEPDSSVVLAEPPSVAAAKLIETIKDLPWTSTNIDVLDLNQQALAANLKSEDAWTHLAILLFDGQHYAEALTAFGLLEKSADIDLRFVGLVWQAHILDLLARRSEAVEKYQAALKVPGNPEVRYDQYHMKINRAWVEDRLKKPFERD